MSVPRRPKGESDSVKARFRSGFVDAEQRDTVLSSFLGGGAAAASAADDSVTVALRSVLKKSETTKIKALTELEKGFAELEDAALLPHIGPFANAFRQSASSESAVVRRKLCRCLELFFLRSKDVKIAVARELSTIFGTWLMLSCDPWPEVAADALSALNVAFPGPKLLEASKRFSSQTLAWLAHELESTLSTPLPADPCDARVNTTASCLGTIGKLVDLFSADTDFVAPVLTFVRENTVMTKIVPPAGAKGGAINKASVARVAALNMFGVMVRSSALSADDTIHGYISRIVQSALFDADATVSTAAWSLYLTWLNTVQNDSSLRAIDVTLTTLTSYLPDATTPSSASFPIVLSSLMPFLSVIKKFPSTFDAKVSAMTSDLESLTIANTDSLVKLRLATAWLECWSTLVPSQDLLAACDVVFTTLEKFRLSISTPQRFAELNNALTATLVRFVSRAASLETEQQSSVFSSIRNFVDYRLKDVLGPCNSAVVFASIVVAADRLGPQSAVLRDFLSNACSSVAVHVESVSHDLPSLTQLVVQLKKIRSVEARLKATIVERLNAGNGQVVSLIVKDNADLLQNVEATVSSDARRALVEAYASAGREDALPEFLRPAWNELAASAAQRWDWDSVTALLSASSSDAIPTICETLRQALSKVKSIDDLVAMLAITERLLDAGLQGQDAVKLLRDFGRSLVEVMPAWSTDAFAVSELEDVESSSDDEESACSSDGTNSVSTSNSNDAAADLSAAAAARLTASAAADLRKLCDRVAGGSHVLQELGAAVVSTIVSAEGSDAVRNGRPTQTSALAVFSQTFEFTQNLLCGSAFEELVSDCLDDLEDVEAPAQARAIEQGRYPRSVVRSKLFKQPTAAVGLMAVVVSEFVSSEHPLTEPLEWAVNLTRCLLVEGSFTDRVTRALLRLLHRVTDLIDGLQLGAALTNRADSAILTSAFARFIATSTVLSNSTKLSWLSQMATAFADRFAKGDTHHAVTLRCLLRTLEAAQLGIITKRLPEPTSAAIAALFERTPDATVAAAALQLLRLMAAKPTPLSPALVKRAVQLRDAAPRQSHEGIAVVAEIMLWSCADAGLAMEAATAAERSVVMIYSLHHLPTNGKLGQRTPLMAPLPISHLRALANVLSVMRRGLTRLQTIHASSAADGALTSLRTTLNLADLDIACECVLRLKTVSADSSAELVEALGDVSRCVGGIQRAEMKTLRASPKSVATVANLLASLHFWLCSRPARTFAQDGDEFALQQVIVLTNRVASITLVESDAPSSLQALVPVITRGPVKPMPGRATSGSIEVKPRTIKRHLSQCVSTSKGRLSLQSYFAAWYACLTNEVGLCESMRELQPQPDSSSSGAAPSAGVDNQNAVYQLLDIILALAHSKPADVTSGQRSYISDALSGRESAAVGFDFALIGEAPREETKASTVNHLTLCAFALLSLLMQRRTVRFVRTWVEGLNRSLRNGFEALVESYLSPALTQLALAEVLAHSPTGSSKFEPSEFNGAVSLTVIETSRQVLARFTADDVSFDVKFSIPAAYPLRPATIDQESIKPKTRAGVPAEKWRAWMLKITMMLLNGGNTVWGCIALIAENLQKQLEGVEPCPICYSVISQTTHKLPDMSCLVCKNSKFHSGCLYEWWGNSGQTSCPMCRSPWFSS